MTHLSESVFSWGFAAKALTWGAAMAGVLQLRHLSGSWSHLICGPWGCGPPLEAVLTCHLVWFLLLMPAVLGIASYLDPAAVRTCGGIATGLGIMGLIGVAIWVGVSWLPQVSALDHKYVLQKYAFTVACLVDVPIVQFTVCGGFLLACAQRAARGQTDESDLSPSEPL